MNAQSKWVADVVADPAFRDAAIPNQLIEVMKRSRGSLNPHNVQAQLVSVLRQRMLAAEALVEHFKNLCIEAGGYITATDKDGEYAESFIRRLRPTPALPKEGT